MPMHGDHLLLIVVVKTLVVTKTSVILETSSYSHGPALMDSGACGHGLALD